MALEQWLLPFTVASKSDGRSTIGFVLLEPKLSWPPEKFIPHNSACFLHSACRTYSICGRSWECFVFVNSKPKQLSVTFKYLNHCVYFIYISLEILNKLMSFAYLIIIFVIIIIKIIIILSISVLLS